MLPLNVVAPVRTRTAPPKVEIDSNLGLFLTTVGTAPESSSCSPLSGALVAVPSSTVRVPHQAGGGALCPS
jgi:hypothetical protein